MKRNYIKRFFEENPDILFHLIQFVDKNRTLNLMKYNKKAQNSLKITKEDYDNTFRFVPERPLKSIAFNVKFNSRPGENVWVLGSIPEFGNWGLNGALS